MGRTDLADEHALADVLRVVLALQPGLEERHVLEHHGHEPAILRGGRVLERRPAWVLGRGLTGLQRLRLGSLVLGDPLLVALLGLDPPRLLLGPEPVRPVLVLGV
jgi:hypothetical protein